MERLVASLQAIWPDDENVEKTSGFPLCLDTWPLLEASWKRLGAIRSVLKTSWSYLGAAAAFDAAFDATEAASKLLRSALGSILSCFEALLDLS